MRFGRKTNQEQKFMKRFIMKLGENVFILIDFTEAENEEKQK